MPPLAIVAIRHGESEWNALRRKYPSEEQRYSSLLYTPDCPLTHRGVEQSLEAGHCLEQYLINTFTENLKVLYVVSPLRRALQTALYIQKTCTRFPSSSPPIVNQHCTEILSDSCDIGSTPEVLGKEFNGEYFEIYHEMLAHDHMGCSKIVSFIDTKVGISVY